jgi:hypothetical protein
VLAGRWRDPQVCAHVLIGAAAGVLIWTADFIRMASAVSTDGLNTTGGLFLLNGTRFWISGMASRLNDALQQGLFIFFVIFGLRTILRKDWLAALVAAVVFSFLEGDIATSLNWKSEFIVYVMLFAALMFVLLRLGMVATTSAIFFLNMVNGINLGTDLTTWYAPTGFATAAVMLVIIFYVFRRALGNQAVPQLS